MTQSILMAVIAAPHGLDGAVKLKVFAERFQSLKQYKRFSTDRTHPLTLRSVRHHGVGVIAHFLEIADRTTAEAWRGAQLFVDRSLLPPIEPNEIYHADLIGMVAITQDGREIGTIIGVPNYGAGDLLEIRRNHGTTTLVSLRTPAILAIDAHTQFVTIDSAFID